MASVIINGNEIQFNAYNLTLIQLCDLYHITVPRFCYHDQLSIAGNCRMCLVEIDIARKPVVACATNVTPGTSIQTNSILIRKVREHILEFLLINHPLDCPICDQGGECDLQDQSMIFGADKGRFLEVKRSVEDKNFGPFIKTIMTRCIHCTRCVRFMEEVADFPVIGTMGRGRDTEISMYFDNFIPGEIVGNIIDLCPVGALTSKPYAFTSRPWELTSVETIDTFDSFNTKIRIDIKGNTIMRVLPSYNNYLNNEWISDRVRFSYDGYLYNRITFPVMKKVYKLQSHFDHVSWELALRKIYYLITKDLLDSSIYFYGGTDSNDLYSLFLLKFWIDSIEKYVFFFRDGNNNYSLTRNYLLGYSLKSLIDKEDSFFFYNINLRKHLPIMNTKFKKKNWRFSNPIYYIGSFHKFTYKVTHLGLSNRFFMNALFGKSFLSNTLLRSSFSLLYYTNGLYHKLFSILLNYLNFNLCSITNLNDTIHYKHFGFFNSSHYQDCYLKTRKINIYYLINYKKLFSFQPYSYIIYQGSHGNWNAMRSNLILPSFTDQEYTGFYMNLEGIVCKSLQSIYSPGLSKSSSDIYYFLIDKPYLSIYLNNEYFNDFFSFFLPFLHYREPLSVCNFSLYQTGDDIFYYQLLESLDSDPNLHSVILNSFFYSNYLTDLRKHKIFWSF